MDGDQRAVKQLLLDAMERSGTGRVGIPRISWIACVNRDLNLREYGLYFACSLAMHRDRYRSRIVLAVPHTSR